MVPGATIRFTMAGDVEEGHRRRHSPLFCGIQYNHAGRVRLRIGDRGYDLDGSWAFLTWPGTVFDYELAGSGPHRFRFVCMEPESIGSLLARGLFQIHSAPVRIHQAERFDAAMDEAIRLIRSGAPERYLRTVWQVEDILLQLGEQVPPGAEASPPERQVRRLAETIERHPEWRYDFRREAEKLRVTLRHFRRVFKECRGLPPNRYLIHCRLHRAGELLQQTREPVGVVAARVGFDNEFYFSMMFKRKFSLSPSAYRKEFHFALPLPPPEPGGDTE